MSASEVAPQFTIGLFPLTKRFGRRWQAGGQTERVKQAVGRKSLQIFPIGVGRRAKGPGLKSHTFHRKRTRLRSDYFVVNRSGDSGFGARPLVLKGERRWTKNSSGSSHGGSCHKLTTADFLHDKFLPQTKRPIRAVLRSIFRMSIGQRTISRLLVIRDNPMYAPAKTPAFFVLRIVSYHW